MPTKFKERNNVPKQGRCKKLEVMKVVSRCYTNGAGPVPGMTDFLFLHRLRRKSADPELKSSNPQWRRKRRKASTRKRQDDEGQKTFNHFVELRGARGIFFPTRAGTYAGREAFSNAKVLNVACGIQVFN